jgi:invasion protein IalB
VPLPCVAYAQESAWQHGKKPSAWVKLCEKTVCMTLHERVDGNTGEVLISAAVRKIEGQDKQYFRVMLTPRVVAEQNVHATIFSEETWERVKKSEKVEKSDDAKLQTLNLGLLRCSAAGCIGEVDATPELLSNLKTSGGLLVYATVSTGCHCQVTFPVPLAGFAEALAGPPTNQWHSRWPPIWPE